MQPKDILAKLIADKYGGVQAAFARAIKRQPAQINQWLTGHRKLDTKGQRHIEKELNLPVGFMCGEAVGEVGAQQYSLAINEPAPHHYRPLAQQVCELVSQIDDMGLRNLIDIAQ